MTNFKNTTRRGFLAGTGAALAAPALLRATRAYAANPTLRIGHVAPRTGRWRILLRQTTILSARSARHLLAV